MPCLLERKGDEGEKRYAVWCGQGIAALAGGGLILFVLLGRDQTLADSVGGGLDAVMEVELLEDIAQVGAHGVLANAEGEAYFAVAAASRHPHP